MCGRLAVSVVDDLPNLFAVVAKRARTSASRISAALATFITFPLQLSALSLCLSRRPLPPSITYPRIGLRAVTAFLCNASNANWNAAFIRNVPRVEPTL